MCEESLMSDISENVAKEVSNASLYNEILNAYEAQETSIKIEYLSTKITYVSPVNFNESIKSPIHRWFPYKEGFSPSFVKKFLSEYCLKPNANVLDPFAGVGTTLLEGVNMGFNTYGFEVSPMSYFVAGTKLKDFDDNDLTDLKRWSMLFTDSNLTEVAQMPPNKTVISYFHHEVLTDLLRIKAFYKCIENQNVQALFKLAFLNCLERFSTHRKAGNGVKRKTRPSFNQSEKALGQIKLSIIQDLEKFVEDIVLSSRLGSSNLTKGSCLTESLYTENVKYDVILTSPPYANCFDYSKIYMTELWLGDFFVDAAGQKDFRQQSVRSHVHARWESRYFEYGLELVNKHIYNYLTTIKLWSNQIPIMLSGYFADMGYLLNILSKKCNQGATIGLVVGNSYYGGLPIATDLLISMLGRQFGFETLKISVYRNIVVSSQQFSHALDKKFMRESLVIMRKI